jgi:sigma-B regulation protein RsbU (phosphoserine phosphatase)
MVVSSSAEESEVVALGPTGRLEATESNNPLVQATAHFLAHRLRDLGSVDFATELHFEYEEETVYVRVTPLRPEVGLDWLVVVAVPEGDFMDHVRAHARTTVLLCLIGLGLANLLALVTTRWLSRPLLELSIQAGRIREGEFDVHLPAQSTDELGTLTAAISDMAKGLKEREVIRDAFGRYVDPELAKAILREPGALEVGGTVRTVTVLLSDLRGFTSISERLGPALMVTTLNRYLTRMTEVIVAHEGTINEFIGDAILVLFGALRPQEDQAERAVRCAIAMQAELALLNEETAELEAPSLEMGIAVHTDNAVVGNIGGERRAKFGVVGDAVNLASRIESLTIGTQILIGPQTAERVRGEVRLGPVREETFKGRSKPLEIYEVLGDRTGAPGPERLVAVRLPARLRRLEGKSVSGTETDVIVTGLGVRTLQIEGDIELLEGTNIELRLGGDGEAETGPVSAKVTSILGPPDGADTSRSFVAVITWAAPEDREHLLRARESSDGSGSAGSSSTKEPTHE